MVDHVQKIRKATRGEVSDFLDAADGYPFKWGLEFQVAIVDGGEYMFHYDTKSEEYFSHINGVDKRTKCLSELLIFIKHHAVN